MEQIKVVPLANSRTEVCAVVRSLLPVDGYQLPPYSALPADDYQVHPNLLLTVDGQKSNARSPPFPLVVAPSALSLAFWAFRRFKMKYMVPTPRRAAISQDMLTALPMT